jgi:hypothetical protein
MRFIALALASLLASTACGADPEPTLQLGTVQVQGNEQIIQTLHAIKLALRAPFSDSAEHADDVVCRIDKQLGDAREYLDCSTNRDYTRRRDDTQLEILKHLGDPSGGDPLAMFVAKQPDHHVHAAVNGAALQALLTHIPDVLPAPDAKKPAIVPAASTQKAPASATSQPATQW